MKSIHRMLVSGALLLAACDGGGDAHEDLITALPPVDCGAANAQRNPYFGDLHVHTKYSLDASTQGTIVGPHDAYRFALGERLGIQPYTPEGEPLRFTQLSRPLDFAAVTDHVELFGETEICTNPDYIEYNSPECQMFREEPEQAFTFFNLWNLGVPRDRGQPPFMPRLPYCGPTGSTCVEAAKTPWRDIRAAAEAYYDREDCRFTTFVAYEWTGSPRSNNLHRNVIFRSEIAPDSPPAYQEFPAPEELWAELTDLCVADEGCEYLTIPHNSNLSAGLMFKTTDDNGAAYTQDFAQRRQLNEPLAEIMQHKGQSECLNNAAAGVQDELCGFEILPYNNLTGDRFHGFNTGPPMVQDFLREALKEGLVQQIDLGANPFKYGFVGSSDTHVGTPGGVLENAFTGHGGAGAAASEEVPPGLTDVIEANPGGLAVLWAEQNTRESLYAAMRRREAYGTSGTRPVVRFFGGWDLPLDQCGGDFVATGYAQGVPMGGDLPARPNAGAKLRFAVSALRDPGALGEPVQPLQHIQIVKGWVESGVKKEVVVDVAGDRNNGATVNEATCATSGPGFAELCTVWEDPDFDPADHAFYYARVVENPSCRWATQQCVAAQVTCPRPAEDDPFAGCCNPDYPKTIQERAWTSPVWYTPPGT